MTEGHGWRRTRLKYVAACNPETLPETTAEDYTFKYVDIGDVQQGVVHLDGHPITFGSAPSRARRIARVGDIAASTVRTYLRAIAAVPESIDPLVFSTGFALLRPSDGISGRFLAWYLQSDAFVTRVEARSTGVSYPAITASELMSLDLWLPDEPAQAVIADFLDRETAQIDTLIAEQLRLVDLLKERRYAQRAQLVLHGIASAFLVRSPLEWADTLPARWPVVPLTAVAKLESGHTPSRSRDDWWTDCHIPWVSLHDVGAMRMTKFLERTAHQISDAGLLNSSARVLPAGTVVLSRDATVGRTAIMAVPMATSQHFAAWICGPRLDPEYLWALFSDAMQPHFDSFQNGSTIRTIGMGDLKTFRIPLPPRGEQRAIVQRLNDTTATIDRLIVESERLISLAGERRSALITAAVTGKIDVRDMGA